MKHLFRRKPISLKTLAFIILIFVLTAESYIMSYCSGTGNGSSSSSGSDGGGCTRNVRIGFFGVFIGDYGGQGQDRKAAAMVDIQNIIALSNELNELDIINKNTISKTSWTDQELLDALGELRKTLQRDEYDAWIGYIFGHGIFTGDYNTLKMTNSQRVTYETIKSFFINAPDLHPHTQHKPRLATIYSCKGKMNSAVDTNNDWNVFHQPLIQEWKGYPVGSVSTSPSKTGLNSSNQVIANMASNQLLPNENVFWVEGTHSPYKVQTGPDDCGTIPVMSMINYLSKNRSIIFKDFAQQLVNDIRFMHKYWTGKNIDPWSPSFSNTSKDVFIVTKNPNYTMSIKVLNYRNRISHILEEVEQKKAKAIQDAKEMKTWEDDVLPGCFESTAILSAFQSLRYGKKHVSFKVFANYMKEKECVMNEYINEQYIKMVTDNMMKMYEYKSNNDDGSNSINYKIFEPVHNIFDSMKKFGRNESIKEMMNQNKLLFYNGTLKLLLNDVSEINNKSGSGEIRQFYDTFKKNTVMATFVPMEATKCCGVVYIVKFGGGLVITTALNVYIDRMIQGTSINCITNDLGSIQKYVISLKKITMEVKLNFINESIDINKFNINYLQMFTYFGNYSVAKFARDHDEDENTNNAISEIFSSMAIDNDENSNNKLINSGESSRSLSDDIGCVGDLEEGNCDIDLNHNNKRKDKGLGGDLFDKGWSGSEEDDDLGSKHDAFPEKLLDNNSKTNLVNKGSDGFHLEEDDLGKKSINAREFGDDLKDNNGCGADLDDDKKKVCKEKVLNKKRNKRDFDSIADESKPKRLKVDEFSQKSENYAGKWIVWFNGEHSFTDISKEDISETWNTLTDTKNGIYGIGQEYVKLYKKVPRKGKGGTNSSSRSSPLDNNGAYPWIAFWGMWLEKNGKDGTTEIKNFYHHDWDGFKFGPKKNMRGKSWRKGLEKIGYHSNFQFICPLCKIGFNQYWSRGKNVVTLCSHTCKFTKSV